MSKADPLAMSHGGGDLLARLQVAEKKPPIDQDLKEGWQTVRQLGHGAHGRCYLMRKPDESMIVHKRVPVSHMRPADQEVAEREANILAAFDHPYIIRYDRAFVRQGQLCIAMEHAVGGDLSAHLQSLKADGKRPSVSDALDWFVQLLLALHYVHGYKVLHRDVALKNVFLAGDGTVKLGDFGVARVLESTQELAVTKVGTPCYIAPERCEGRPYSYEADVWAMGCLLYELVTTRPAFSAETIPQVSAKILKGELSPFDETDSSIPQGVRSLITTILSVAPESRPTIASLLENNPVLKPHVAKHERVRSDYAAPNGPRRIASVDIPLIGYEGQSSKTKFSERPVFVDGGGRIVDEKALSAHDEKVLGARQRRQRQLAEKRGASGGSGGSSIGLGSASSASAAAGGSGPDFSKPMNFGAGGVVGFIVQQSSSAAQAAAAGKDQQAGGGGGGAAPQEIS